MEVFTVTSLTWRHCWSQLNMPGYPIPSSISSLMEGIPHLSAEVRGGVFQDLQSNKPVNLMPLFQEKIGVHVIGFFTKP